MHILFIDDDEITLQYFSEIFEKRGFTVSVARTGQEALDKAKTQRFHIIVYDIMLPDIKGTALLTEMPHSESTLKIIITGYPSVEHTVDAMHRGADYFFTKPVNPEDLLQFINAKLHTNSDQQS